MTRPPGVAVSEPEAGSWASDRPSAASDHAAGMHSAAPVYIKRVLKTGDMLVDGETPAAALIYRFLEYLTETEGYLDFIRWLNEWQHVFLAEQDKRRELYTTFEICRKHCQIKPEYVGAYNGAMEISRGYEVAL
jgi:hypothetical protein